MTRKLRLIVLSLLLISGVASAQEYIPDELAGWQRWVLDGKEYRNCPFHFDRGAADRSDFVCAWPGTLQVEVTASAGRFVQRWTVYAEEQWIALPGSSEHWPDRVTADGRAIEVVAHDNVPSIRLGPGDHAIAGRFAWDERPGVLPIPPQSGLIALLVDGRAVARPEMNGNNLFLGERRSETRAEDAVRTTVYRLVSDNVPTRMVTQLQIDVSGSVREELFGPVLPDGFVPLNLRSQLPARLEADGNLRLQVRPGRWVVQIDARGPGVMNTVAASVSGTNLPDTEIWSYEANDRLRVTAAEGLPPVDPAQVEVPANWRTYPAFRVEQGASLSIDERSRGVVSASNELTLERTMWLDFNGDGFVVEDSIGGEMRTGWRLDMAGPYALLSASEAGESLLITSGEQEGRTGVEVRMTDVNLETLGRSDTRGTMPATGWDARFARVSAQLNLPPGHKLLAAPGVDDAPGSWASRWQLLDFFLVLIITIAVWRLFNPTAGVIALLALVLSFHEPMAPTWLWLNLLIAVALLRVAPEGRLYRIVRGYQFLSAAALVLALVPFVAGQLRIAIYPQLEPQYNQYGLYDFADVETEMYEPAPATDGPALVGRKAESVARSLPVEADSLEEVVVTGSRVAATFSRYAPNAIVQAGPGIPSWRWNTYTLRWSGPVDAEQTVRLVVMPRWLVSALRFVEVALMLLFAAIIAAEMARRRWTLPGGLTLGRGATVGMLAVAACTSILLASSPAGAQTPDPALLEELERRLLEPPDCVPRCAEIAAADIDIRANSIGIALSVHALEDVAIPLPGSARGWRPTAVAVDGADNARIFRQRDGTWWLSVAPGRHEVILRGAIPETDSLEIPFPTPARVVAVTSEGWTVAGVKDRRLESGSLQLSRLQSDGGGDEVRWEASRFPAFARVDRFIGLDLDWRAETSVVRVAPAVGAMTLEVPLLDGETIVSGDVRVVDGRAIVTMGPQQRVVRWASNLPQESPLKLRAPQDAPWSELWRIGVGRIWNATFSGIPESNTGEYVNAVRVAEFDPRAGEELVVDIRRPEASAGSTLAFDAVTLDVNHGHRSSDVNLNLQYRSTRGAQHVVRLPQGVEVTAVSIDGRPQTLRADDDTITLPILPGEHAIGIGWRTADSMGFRTTTPTVDLGAPASNIEIAMTRPDNRWLLGTTGPQLGPAVLYWPELAALVLFALILGRIGLSPLGTRHWLLLGLGFSTFNWPVLAVVVVWLFACGLRDRLGVAGLDWWRFNLVQVVVGGLTVIALLAILTSLPQGLLGTPDMHVTGYNSWGTELGWFADRSESVLPSAAAYTVPMWIYKVLILAWALWLSFALVRWLPWVWGCFSRDGFWRSRNESKGAA